MGRPARGVPSGRQPVQAAQRKASTLAVCEQVPGDDVVSARSASSFLRSSDTRRRLARHRPPEVALGPSRKSALRRRLILPLALMTAFGGAACGELTGSAGGHSHASFCDTHDCIPSFDEGQGYIVQCQDGEWSHSGGIQGACSGHGGET